MKNKFSISRFIVMCLVVLESFLALNSVAKANDITFGSVSAGTLEKTQQNSLSTVLESVSQVDLSVSIKNQAAKITILPPVFVSGASLEPDNTQRIGFLTVGSTTVRSDQANNSIDLAPGTTNLQVKMRVQRPQPFLAGEYKYNVILNVTVTDVRN